MHKEVDRIYDFTSYLNFQLRCFKKLQALGDDNLTKAAHPGGRSSVVSSNSSEDDSDPDPIWAELADTIEDLSQWKDDLATYKDRFNNLIELEFNISNTDQAEDSSFLTGIATIFLPISYLAAIWGITTISLTPLQYVYVAIPVLITSIIFTLVFARAVRAFQKVYYKSRKERPDLHKDEFVMLGDQVPNEMHSRGLSRAREGDGEKDVLKPPGRRDRGRSGSRVRRRTASRSR
jgi:hypothetical protein